MSHSTRIAWLSPISIGSSLPSTSNKLTQANIVEVLSEDAGELHRAKAFIGIAAFPEAEAFI